MMRKAILITQLLLSGILVARPDPEIQARDVHGGLFRPFKTEGKASVLFFLSAECPISRFYAPEIQKICKSYRSNGVGCSLVYEDLLTTPAIVRRHMAEYGYQGIPATLDETGGLARQAGASITPQAVVVGGAGQVLYRGRIDNYYADLGKPRGQATVHDLTDALDAIVAGRRVSRPETQAVGCYIASPELLKANEPRGGTK